MENLQDMIRGVIQETDEVVEMFYQQKVQEAYTRLDFVTQDMLKAIEVIFQYKAENENLDIDENSLLDSLKEVVSAIEEKDSILVADVLKYEVIERLEAILEQL